MLFFKFVMVSVSGRRRPGISWAVVFEFTVSATNSMDRGDPQTAVTVAGSVLMIYLPGRNCLEGKDEARALDDGGKE